MLSYINLGEKGVGIGNQLFQYAFLRTQAEKLGVKFYCPQWIGDEIFDLDDKDLRETDLSKVKQNIKSYYRENRENNFEILDNTDTIVVQDNTDILGFFESENYFDKDSIKKWYKFRGDKFVDVLKKYKDIDFNNAIAMHLRLGDKLHMDVVKTIFYVPRIKYYSKALVVIEKLGRIKVVDENTQSGIKERAEKYILVFSDDIELAKTYFKDFQNLIYIEGNSETEDLLLMSRCADIVCSASTFSWWAGYLNKNPNKKVIFPKECLWRPKFSKYERYLIPAGWIKISALYPIIDNYFFIR